MTESIHVYKVGQHWIAHRSDDDLHDCAADDSLHGMADHPIAAMRALLRLEDES